MSLSLAAIAWLACGSTAWAEVSLPPGATEGVRWAADLVEEAAGDVPISCALVPRSEWGSEGFRLRSLAGQTLVEAADWPGLMYGLLELERRARAGRVRLGLDEPPTSPGMRLRAVSRSLQLYLDIPLYENAFGGWVEHDRSAEWWFHDEEAWREVFRRLARRRINGYVFLHPHLFPGFIDYSTAYPEATYLAPEELDANQRALRAAIRLGREYNVTLHWLRWHIWVPKGFAEAHGIEQGGADTQLTRDYEAWCVAQFYRAFPGFGSIISQCGESPPGCADFIREATVRGLRQVEPRPAHIVWSWCANPPDVKGIIDAYDGETLVMNYLQYEQLFTDRADPRIGKFSEAVGGADMVALGGPKGAHPYLFWASPAWARNLMRTLHQDNNGRGMVIEYTDPDDRWLAEEAFAYYAWRPDGGPEEGRWIDAIAERYGSRALAGPLLTAMERASRIVPRQVMLTHSQSGAFMPQLGLSLLQCLEMPSVTSYIFENSVETDGDGYLTPRMGKCWSSADFDWGERVVPIRQFALAQIGDQKARREALEAWMQSRRALGFSPAPIRARDTRPLAMAEQIERLARETLAALDEVEPHVPSPRRPGELESVIRLLRLNAALGLYFAAKDRAAVGWEVCRFTGSSKHRDMALEEIDAAVAAWTRYATLAKETHGERLWAYLSTIAHPPPWSQLDLWHGYTTRPWRIDDVTGFWRREAELLKERLETWAPEELEAPIFDELRALDPRAEIVHTFDFEEDEAEGYELITRWTPQVKTTRDPALVISGGASLLADSTGSETEWNEVFNTRVPLEPGARYQVAVKYRVVKESDEYRSPFGMAMRTPKGGMANEKGDARMWGGRPGQVRERVMTAELSEFDDYYLFVSIRGQAAIVIDDLRIARVGE